MKSNTSLTGRIVTIFAGIMMLFMICGKWLNFDAFFISGEYSLFEISDLLDSYNSWIESGELTVLVVLLVVSAIVIFALSAVTIVTSIINNPISKSTALVGAAVSIALTVFFTIALIYVDYDLEMDVVSPTAKPYLLVLFSVISAVGTMITKNPAAVVKIANNVNTSTPIRPNIAPAKCPSCGAENNAGMKFCVQCGAEIKVPEPPKVSAVRYCTACGAAVEQGMNFCTSCGAKMQ